MTRRERRERVMPHGIWTLLDGRQVLFNEHFEPIWQRVPGKRPQPVPPRPSGKVVRTDFLYGGQHTSAAKFDAGAAVLRAWRIPVPEGLNP